jgi:hypothetical protein
MEATAVRQISNASGSIYLFDLYKNKNQFYHEPCLVFEKVEHEGCWDNSDYVYNFLRRLKEDKKDSLKELKKFCEKSDLNFNNTKQDLVDIYKTSKKLKFWKNEKDFKTKNS